jgi:hypothetical protein
LSFPTTLIRQLALFAVIVVMMATTSAPAHTQLSCSGMCIGFVNIADLETWLDMTRKQGDVIGMQFFNKERSEGKIVIFPRGTKLKIISENFPVAPPYYGLVMVHTVEPLDHPGHIYYMPERTH